MDPGAGEMLASAFHFDKETGKAHGHPFIFLIKEVRLSTPFILTTTHKSQGELFSATKERLSKRIGLKGKQFDKIKFAVVSRSAYAKPEYLTDGMYTNSPLNLTFC